MPFFDGFKIAIRMQRELVDEIDEGHKRDDTTRTSLKRLEESLEY
jgi:hypothetical protein